MLKIFQININITIINRFHYHWNEIFVMRLKKIFLYKNVTIIKRGIKYLIMILAKVTAHDIKYPDLIIYQLVVLTQLWLKRSQEFLRDRSKRCAISALERPLRTASVKRLNNEILSSFQAF